MRPIGSILWLAILPGCAGSVAPPSPPQEAVLLISQLTNADCLKATGSDAPCRGIAWQDGNSVETGIIDIDGDGDLDLIVRRLSSVTCGSRGCSTDIYLRTPHSLTIAEPRLVTVGPISTCARDGERGLRASASASAPCFIFRPANQ